MVFVRNSSPELVRSDEIRGARCGTGRGNGPVFEEVVLQWQDPDEHGQDLFQ